MRRAVWAVALGVFVVGSSVPAGAAEGPRHVDAAVQVTGSPNPFRAYASPVVAVDPANPDNVVVASGEARSSQCTLTVSTDGGLSWSDAASPMPKEVAACVRNTNGRIADLAFAPDGTLYYAFAGYPAANDFHSKIYVARSTDLGKTFDAVAIPGLDPPYPSDSFGTPALPTVAVDPANRGRVYVAFQENYGLFSMASTVFPPGKFSSSYPLRAYVARSDDGGKTFGQPVPVSNTPGDHASRAYVAIGGDGSVYVFSGEVNTPQPFGSTNPPAASRLFLATSRDGAKTFTQKVIYTGAPGKSGDAYTVLLAIAPAVDRRTGDLYVAWEDTARAAPAILSMRSTDKGATWSEPVKVNDVDPQRTWDFDEEEPMLTVAPDGRLDAVWLDYRGDPTFKPGANAENAFQNVYYASSSDGGRTWSPNMRVSDRSIDRRLSDVWSTGVHSALGLASMDDRIYVAWDDTRNATADSKAQDVYFTRIRPAGELLRSAGSSGVSTGDKALWASFGVAVALLVGGAALLLARAMAGRSPARSAA